MVKASPPSFSAVTVPPWASTTYFTIYSPRPLPSPPWLRRAWSPRQKKYFEVGSCSNLGDAQARRLGIRVRNKEKGNYFAHTLNNTVVAPPRMLIAFLENNLQADGSIRIPEPLRMYMGGKEFIK